MNNLLDGVKAGWIDEPDSDEENSQGGDVESGRKGKSSSRGIVETRKINYMDHFFREMDNIKADVEALGLASKAIRELHEVAISATTNEEENLLSK